MSFVFEGDSLARLHEALGIERLGHVLHAPEPEKARNESATNDALAALARDVVKLRSIADNKYDGGCWLCAGDAVGVIAGKKACADCLEAFEGVDPAELGV